jgi:signal transduction histidine kinase
VVDSLEQRLASFKGSNEERGNLLIDLSQAYRGVDTVKGGEYIMEALHVAQRTGLKNVEKRAYFGKGLYQMQAGQYYLAHTNYQKAEKLAIQLNDDEYLCRIYGNQWIMFDLFGDVANSLFYADKILEVAAERYDLTTLMPYDTLNMAQDDMIPAHIFGAQLQKGKLRYSENPEDGQKLIDHFLDMLQKSKHIKSGYTNLYPQIALQCGETYNNLNRPREALYYLHLARENFKTSINPEQYMDGMSNVYASLAESYAMLQRTDSAEYYMKKSEEGAVLYKNQTREVKYRARSVVEAAKGNYRSALESFKKLHHLTDSIAKAGKTTEIARMKNWHELEQKDNENRLLQHEHQKQERLIMILTGTLFLIFALLSLSIILYRKTAEKNRELKNLHSVKDKLFSVVAHDLRSPMGALMSMLNLANENEIDAKTQAQLLKDISARVDDTYGLLDNLLHWSKSQMQGMVPKPVCFDAQEGSRAVTDSLQHIAAHKNIVLNNCIEKQQIYADRDMFAVVVRNLTMNAVKYKPEVGEIILASELKDNMLIISVKDNGTGMTQEVQDKLFKLSETRSQRGTNNESGTGLGLVLCADFVKINGGNIWFTSKQGEGSTFYFSVLAKS